MKHRTRASEDYWERTRGEAHIAASGSFLYGRMFLACVKGIVFLEKAGVFNRLAAFLGALEVKRKIYSKENLQF